MSKVKINWFIWFQGLLFIGAAMLVIQMIANASEISHNISKFMGVLSPFIFGGVIAYFLDTPCKRLEGRFSKINKIPFISKCSKGLSILAVYLLVIAMIVMTFNVVFPVIIQNIIEFISAIPVFYEEFQLWMYNLDLSGVNHVFNAEEAIQSFFDLFSVQEVIAHATTGLNSVVGFAVSMTGGIIDLFIAIITSIYCLIYKKDIFSMVNRLLKLFMKESQQKALKGYVVQASNIFYKFIATQFLDACILGVLSTILLAVLNVRFAVTLGFFLGVCNMIPKFGSIFGSVLVIALAFVTGGATQGIVVAITLTILQQIDGNIIGPKLMGDALAINPIIVFIALAFGGAYFGVLGMFLSIPVAAMLKIIFMELVEARERKIKIK